jgi:hypothetical protein
MDAYADQFLAKLTDSLVVGGVTQYAWTEQIVDPSTNLTSDAPSARTGTTTTGYAQEINNVVVTTPFYAMIQLRTLLLGSPVYDFQVGADSLAFVREIVSDPDACGHFRGYLRVRVTDPITGCISYVDGPLVAYYNHNP